jgi:DNA repair ATPase RecN
MIVWTLPVFIRQIRALISEVKRTRTDAERIPKYMMLSNVYDQIDFKLHELHILDTKLSALMKNISDAQEGINRLADGIRYGGEHSDLLKEEFLKTKEVLRKYLYYVEDLKRQKERFENKYGTIDTLISIKQTVEGILHDYKP